MGGYRYFFNGQEADNEVLGEGGFQNYGFRMYDTRLARFLGVDPLTKDYPMLTPFSMQDKALMIERLPSLSERCGSRVVVNGC